MLVGRLLKNISVLMQWPLSKTMYAFFFLLVFAFLGAFALQKEYDRSSEIERNLKFLSCFFHDFFHMPICQIC